MAEQTQTTPALTEAEKAAAKAAGMSERRFAALRGRTKIDEYEQVDRAEREATASDGEGR
jgi:hypothetical protein